MDSDVFHEDRRRPLIEHPELSESGEYFSHPNADLRLKRSETPHNDSQHQKRNDVVEVMVKSTDSGIVSGSNMQSAPFVKGTPPKHTPSFQGISNDGHVKLTLEKLKSIDFANPPTLDFNHPQSPVSALTSRKGPIEKCKMTQSGLKNKKFEWLKCYMVLSKGHLLFYKDEKSAEKNGKHYDTPLGVCDLRNASIALVEKRKKQIIEIKDSETLTEYSIDSSDRYDILNWYSSLKQNVSSLPSPTGFPSPTGCSGHDASSALQRNSSFLASRNASLIAQQNSSIAGSPIMSKSSYSASKSSKRVKSSYSSKDSMALSMIENIPCVDTVQGETVPTKESIIERLLRFFRSRPTIESLREKGVYKFEPVFGSTLEIICKHEQATIPKFIRVITVTIEDKGLETDGLYRVSGNLSTVQKIRCKVDQDNYADVISEEDVHVLTGTLKLFFRELSEPLFPISMNKDFVSAIRKSSSYITHLFILFLESTTEAIRFSKIDELLSKLPTVNRDTLVHLLKHLQRVSNYSSKNRMQIHNLAIIFGPTLFGCDDRPVMAKGKNGKEIKAPIGLKKKVGKSSAPAPVQPNQNLAFKMIMYGQVLEFVFSKIDKFVIFKV
uniref:Rho-GAP domain-containing protein n=1 Tax=Rhabditophanes sp. KR3021 TaxID=114890 RepID=A0AC35U471_9BILA